MIRGSNKKDSFELYLPGGFTRYGTLRSLSTFQYMSFGRFFKRFFTFVADILLLFFAECQRSKSELLFETAVKERQAVKSAHVGYLSCCLLFVSNKQFSRCVESGPREKFAR